VNVDAEYARPLKRSCVLVTLADAVDVPKAGNNPSVRVKSLMIPFSPDLDPETVYVAPGPRGVRGFREFIHEYCDDIRAALVAAGVYPADERPADGKGAGRGAEAVDRKAELAALQGEWELVSLEVNGRVATPTRLKDKAGYDLTVAGNSWRTRRPPDANATFVIDPAKTPKAIDRTSRLGGRPDSPEQTCLGIYKLEGDTLTVCHRASGSERPGAFESRNDQGVVSVWARKKRVTADEAAAALKAKGARFNPDDGPKADADRPIRGVAFGPGADVTDDDLKPLQHLPDLRYVYITGQKRVSGEGLWYLSGQTKLHTLDLNRSGVESKHLDNLAGMPKLWKLGLWRTKVTDDGLEALQDLPALQRLYLDDTAVTDEGIRRLGKHKSLRLVWTENTKVTTAGEEFMRANFPDYGKPTTREGRREE
jgi:uncharacterized protein (TIGR03067 family)